MIAGVDEQAAEIEGLGDDPEVVPVGVEGVLRLERAPPADPLDRHVGFGGVDEHARLAARVDERKRLRLAVDRDVEHRHLLAVDLDRGRRLRQDQLARVAHLVLALQRGRGAIGERQQVRDDEQRGEQRDGGAHDEAPGAPVEVAVTPAGLERPAASRSNRCSGHARRSMRASERQVRVCERPSASEGAVNRGLRGRGTQREPAWPGNAMNVAVMPVARTGSGPSAWRTRTGPPSPT